MGALPLGASARSRVAVEERLVALMELPSGEAPPGAVTGGGGLMPDSHGTPILVGSCGKEARWRPSLAGCLSIAVREGLGWGRVGCALQHLRGFCCPSGCAL